MKKSKKPKKDDIVEISKSAFKNARQTGKLISQSEVIRKVVSVNDDDDEKTKPSGDDAAEDRNPENDSGDECMESIETVDEGATTSDEDAIQIYRDVLSMSDEDRNSDADGKPGCVRLSPPPPVTWEDSPEKVKFKVGELVRYRGVTNGCIYKICGCAREEGTYMIKASGSQSSFVTSGEKIIKADKNAQWVDYWTLNPVIPAPKPWLKKEEPKRKK